MSNVFLATKVPGPNSLRLQKEAGLSVSRGAAYSLPIFVKEARGAQITDVDGNTFIDFTAGISACNSGHCNEYIGEAAKRQIGKFVHTSYTDIPYEPYVALCKKLNEITPGRFAKKSALFNTGAEAVENAIKAAKKFTGRQAVVAFKHAFHGRTLMALSLTSKVRPYKLGFGPFAPEVYRLEYPNTYRKPKDMSEKEYVDYLLEDIKNDFFHAVVDPEQVSCIIMEPVTGEGGFLVPPKRYVEELVKICKKNGIVFIADEIQTGFGRTGKLFASEHFGIQPDIIAMAKSLSNGLPLSAITGRQDIMDSVQEGGFGGTFSGNPVSCKAALAAVDYILSNDLPGKANHIGSIVHERLLDIERRSRFVGNVRGLGAMQAIEIVSSKKRKEFDKKKAKKIQKYAYEHGLLILTTGVYGNVIRLLMPLVIRDEELNEGLDILEDGIRHLR